MLLELERDVPWCGVATERREVETWKSRCVRDDQGAPMLPTVLLLNSKKKEEGGARKEEKGRREERMERGKEGREGGDGRDDGRKSRAMKLLMWELLVSLRVKF